MLINQGVIGSRLWTQSEPDPQIRREARLQVLSGTR
jgi:hypothetical protein